MKLFAVTIQKQEMNGDVVYLQSEVHIRSEDIISAIKRACELAGCNLDEVVEVLELEEGNEDAGTVFTGV